MLTGFQQFLNACIGQTEDETDQPDDAQRDDESQTELEDNSVNDTEPTDTSASEGAETEENDAPSPPEEPPPADDAPPVTIDEGTEMHTDSSAETDEPDAENVSDESSDEISDAAPADSDQPPQSLEPADSVSEDDTEAEPEAASPEQETPEQKTDVSPQTADSEDTETETQETDETDKSDDAETAPERPQVELGIVEEIYDFVEMFAQSTVSGTEQASASGTDCAGGIMKPAIFEHPTPTETAKIDYTLSLPDVDEQEKLFLHFAIGLRDGVVFDDEARQPGGVKFAIEVFDLHNNVGLEAVPDRCFEAVSTECRWAEKGVDLTRYAGKEIVVSFLTECNVAGNSNYAWALWGKPQLRKPKQTTLRKRKRDAEPELRCGLAILHFNDESTQLLEFNQPTSTAVSSLTDFCLESIASEEPPVKISLYTALPKLEIVSVGATTAIVAAGEDFEIQCTLRNTGTAPLRKTDDVRISINGVKLRRGRPRQTVRELEPGEETSLFWVARRFPQPTLATASVSLKSQTAAGEARDTVQGSIAIRTAPPKLESKVVKELYTYTAEDGSVVIGNKNLRILFVRGSGTTEKTDNGKGEDPTGIDENATDSGFEYYVLSVTKGGNYQQVATCPALSEVTYLDASQNRQTLQLVPTAYQLAGNNRGESVIRLSGADTDADGVKWNYEMQWMLAEDAKRIQTECQLQTDGNRELLAFSGPMLYAGQGRNREKKTAALFPGLEFLESDERSSSTRDAAPPLDNRLVPHPCKITVPVLAVEMQKTLVGIIWNPLETWDGENQMLSAIFASPNWHQRQKNHALGVFLPTIPTWVQENQTEASIPYPLTASRPVAIKTEIIVDGNASILDALTHWTDAYGTPEPLQPPRSDEEEVLLSRHGFMHTTWDENTRKSRHCIDWAAHNEPGFGTLLWYDYLATKDEQVKERVQEIISNTVADAGPEGLAARGSCHILRWEFPFYVGSLDAALTYMEAEAQQRIATQESDGSWRWHPTNEKTAILGKAGEAVLGTCAESALLLLKHARITGNKTSREAGLKALEFMKQFSLPRGAQMWECPMYQPDVLAAAHAIGAYVEAFELTRQKGYFKRATYWAETALPFLYHWHLSDRPGMHFASIPVFGTTFYTHPWFGVPVQWNGLVLAYYLQRLNQHTEDERWHQIAEGITVSAMYQQWEDGERKGTYPDGFYGFCTEGKGPHLNPEDIMVNIYTLRGLDPSIKTAITGDIHLSSGAKVDALTLTNDGQLNWQLNYAENEISYALIVGYGRVPQALRARYQFALSSDDTATATGEEPPSDAEAVNGSGKYAETEIPLVQTLEDVESGWRYIEDKDAIFVKYLHPTTEVQFEIS
ncbi:hypothetical protein F4009_22285 [Candidatus Poribacteria bacterium]|nr:hypothetical protein [Candidatus Poribacteria bacterium]MYK96689.1 hypothetical protein [Candidatus Poribacteria bacterium]